MSGTSPRIYKKLLASHKSLSLSSALMKKWNIVAHFYFLILKCFAPPSYQILGEMEQKIN